MAATTIHFILPEYKTSPFFASKDLFPVSQIQYFQGHDLTYPTANLDSHHCNPMDLLDRVGVETGFGEGVWSMTKGLEKWDEGFGVGGGKCGARM
jgi:hypothetical protein